MFGMKLKKWIGYYRPVGETVFLNEKGQERLHNETMPTHKTVGENVKDHSMINYVRALCQ